METPKKDLPTENNAPKESTPDFSKEPLIPTCPSCSKLMTRCTCLDRVLEK